MKQLEKEEKEEKGIFPDRVPLRLDRHTVVYARRNRVEERGGIEGYVRWFNENRRPIGDINGPWNYE
jgi:hypothetical protein